MVGHNLQRANSGLFRRLVGRVPWEGVLKGKKVQKTGYSLRNLKGTGTCCPLVPENEGKIGLAQQRVLNVIQGKKGIYALRKKGWEQQDYKDVMRLCRERSEGPKPD